MQRNVCVDRIRIPAASPDCGADCSGVALAGDGTAVYGDSFHFGIVIVIAADICFTGFLADKQTVLVAVEEDDLDHAVGHDLNDFAGIIALDSLGSGQLKTSGLRGVGEAFIVYKGVGNLHSATFNVVILNITILAERADVKVGDVHECRIAVEAFIDIDEDIAGLRIGVDGSRLAEEAVVCACDNLRAEIGDGGNVVTDKAIKRFVEDRVLLVGERGGGGVCLTADQFFGIFDHDSIRSRVGGVDRCLCGNAGGEGEDHRGAERQSENSFHCCIPSLIL